MLFARKIRLKKIANIEDKYQLVKKNIIKI